jgi:dihydroorotase
VLDDSMLMDSGNFKMNPPIRAKEDKLALIKGIQDGTIDMIATDHAPHSFEEKSKGLKGSLNGIVGLETAFPILYTYLVKEDIITLEKLVEIMSVKPAKRFGLDLEIKDGATANFAVFDLSEEYVVDADRFLSKGKSSPFIGYKVYGKCVMNVINGEVKHLDK